MERKVMVVSVAVGLLGVLSAVMGFAAEATRIKASDVRTTKPNECIYPKSPALALGLTAAVALMMAQAVINTVAGCICCKRRHHTSDRNWIIASISFVVSWVTFILAFLMLLTAATLNDQQGEETMFRGEYCFVVKPGIFAGGAVLALASVALGIIYYVSISTTKSTGPRGPGNQGIVMGQPVIPPQSTEPVFVPESTYNRRQFP